MKIERVLCPIDFSEASTHAIDHAIAIAAWYKARIIALHVGNPILLAVPGLGLSGHGEPGDESEMERLRHETASCFGAATARGIGLDVLIEMGSPARCILDQASRFSADLIVVGTHGTSGFEHFVLGSVTEKVLRKASCPVLTVPPRTRATSRLPFKRLVCAVDFSDWSLEAVRYAFSLAQESDSELVLLHVLEWPWEEPPSPRFEELPRPQALALADYRRYCEQGAEARLESLVRDAPRDLHKVRTRISHGRPYVEILRVAAEVDADLIAIGVHGRNTLDVSLFGSAANQVVRQATCPVLTLRR